MSSSEPALSGSSRVARPSSTTATRPPPPISTVASFTLFSRRSDDAALLEIGDLGDTNTNLAQHRLVVLAELGRDAGLGRRLGELPRRAMHLELSVPGMV